MSEAVHPSWFEPRRLVVLCLVLALAAGAAPPEARVRSELEARYDQMAKAFAARDSTAIFELRTPDFCIHYPGGERDSAARAHQVLASFFAQSLPPIQVRYAIRSLRLTSPEVAVVDIFQKGSRYQVLAGKSRLVEYEVKHKETWRRVKGTWMLASVDDIHDRRRWVDGVSVDPSKPFDPAARPFQPDKP
jgi:hypothetical protein